MTKSRHHILKVSRIGVLMSLMYPILNCAPATWLCRKTSSQALYGAHNTYSAVRLLCAAFVMSLSLHIFVLITIDSIARPVVYGPTVPSSITLRLPGSNRFIQTSMASPAMATETLIAERSQPDSVLSSPESQSTIPVPPISAYRPRNELSVPAQALVSDDMPQPDAPLDGFAELTLLLGENGSVDSILIARSSFPPDYFKKIEKFFSEMRFQPGLIDGIPQKSRFVIEVSTSRLPEILESVSLKEEELSSRATN